MSRSSLLTTAWFGLSLLCLAGQAAAGGLYLNEFGTPSMGTAGAGASAVASDASTSFHNPAGMTRLQGNQLLLGAGLLNSTIKFDPDPDTPIPGNDGGNAGGPGPILGAFYVHDVSDQWKLGVNMISISASILEYDSDWTGRYLVQEVKPFLTLSMTPSFAYKINNQLSVGGGFTVLYARLKQKIAAPPPDGTGQVTLDKIDDIDWGFNLGALFELSPRTRFGLLYQSKIEPELSGDIKIDPVGLEVAIDTKIPLVQLVRGSFYHEFNERWALLGTLGWEDWSDFGNQTISTGRGSTAIPRNWRDTYHYSLGVHYRLNDAWLLQTGITYDTNPVDADDRTPDLALDRQVRYAVGAQYQMSKDLTIGGALEYADYGKAKINNDLLIGEYKDYNIFFFALNANWKF